MVNQGVSQLIKKQYSCKQKTILQARTRIGSFANAKKKPGFKARLKNSLDVV
jgi:hypothetical protein